MDYQNPGGETVYWIIERFTASPWPYFRVEQESLPFTLFALWVTGRLREGLTGTLVSTNVDLCIALATDKNGEPGIVNARRVFGYRQLSANRSGEPHSVTFEPGMQILRRIPEQEYRGVVERIAENARANEYESCHAVMVEQVTLSRTFDLVRHDRPRLEQRYSQADLRAFLAQEKEAYGRVCDHAKRPPRAEEGEGAMLVRAEFLSVSAAQRRIAQYEVWISEYSMRGTGLFLLF